MSNENMDSSSGEYNYKVSDKDLNLWKSNFEARKDTTEQISAEKKITFSWCDINAFVHADMPEPKKGEVLPTLAKKENKNQKHILQNVNGIAYPGELLVIMGSSGAGKTTLLNCMTFRNLKNLKVTGLVCVNSKPISQTQLAAQSCYVQQDDLFIRYLTVREHLIFQSLVRMAAHYTYQERLERVEKVMIELSLKKCENSIIGEPGIIKGISGGERKRLSFASELLTDPSLLFCDEPTTGLDSFMSLNVVQMLKDVARSGRTVITTLHQPSSELYHMFDKLCLMAIGKLAFLGTTSEASNFFAKLQAPCPKNFNPADHYIQLLSIIPGKEETCKRSVESICDAFEKSCSGIRIIETVQKIQKSAKNKEDLWAHKQGHINPYRVGWCAQMRAVFWRSWLSVIKNPEITLRRFYVSMLESLLIVLIYYGQVLNQNGIQNLEGVIFYLLISTTFQNLFGTMDTFIGELQLFFKEHKDGLYRTEIYYLSRVICNTPFPIMVCCLNTTICYFLIGLNPEISRYFTALAISTLVCQSAQGAGYIISVVCTNLQYVMTLVSVTTTPLIIFGGIYLSISSIPTYLRWVSDLSWIKFGYEAYMINQWSDIKYIPCDTNGTCIHNGLEALENKSVSLGDFWPSIEALVFLIITFRIIAFCVLYFRASFKD